MAPGIEGEVGAGTDFGVDGAIGTVGIAVGINKSAAWDD